MYQAKSGRVSRRASALGVLLLLSACGPGGDVAATLASLGLPSAVSQPAASPTPTATSPLIGDARKRRRIGKWEELIIAPDGTIDPAEYRRVAANYNSAEIMDYRLGPTAADFAEGKPQAPAPTLWGPDQDSGYGLWPYGTLPATNPGEPEKCVDSARLPRGDDEARRLGMEGPAWLAGGAMAFLPDDPDDQAYRMGIANVKGADGVNFEPSGGLCMRMYAQWTPDHWVRNSVGAPTNPDIAQFLKERRGLPPVPIAIARGRANASQVSFAAFQDGSIVPMVIGNSIAVNLYREGVRLPVGMVPTAMAVTANNEFLVVNVWDTNNVSGKLAVIALKGRQMACCGPGVSPDARMYWGLPNSWTITGMKLLGFVDLPFTAPSSVDVVGNVGLGNPRGHGENNDPAVGDLAVQSARDLWASVNPISPGSNYWSQMASGGYAVVASRAENKVSFVDLTPLFQFYRQIYLTSHANFNRTLDQSPTDPAKWPLAFVNAPQQTPRVATTLNVAQPTAVLAGNVANSIFGLDRGTWFGESGNPGWSPKEGWSGAEPERYLSRSRAYVASMDGTVRLFNVQGLNFPSSPVGGTVSETPVSTFNAGHNPSFAHINSIGTAPDDVFIISRGDRTITYAFPDGNVKGVLRDSRLIDPVGAAVSVNLAGFGGRGAGKAVFSNFISIVDFNGKLVHTYAVDHLRGPLAEAYPFTTPSGRSVWLWGSSRPFPGKPFMVDMEEII